MKELYILVGSSFQSDQDDYLKRHYYKRSPDLANVFYERVLLNGFDALDVDTLFVSAPEVGTFPFTCRLPRLRQKDLSSQRFNVVSYFTIAGIKHLSKTRALRKKLLTLVKERRAAYDNIVILLCQSYWPYMVAAKAAKKRYGVKIVLMVPDLPRHVGKQTSPIKKWYVAASNSLIKEIADSYVLFSEPMIKEPYIDGAKPHIISEGILNSPNALSPIDSNIKRSFIFYAGSVSFANGMKLLLDAYRLLPSQKPKLLIAGDGDALEFLKKQQMDGVVIMGLVSKAEADNLMRNACLLVSPRVPGSYCSYSFPSKVINYLSCRIPLVSFKLPCYPPELGDIICYPTEISAKALSEAMARCLKHEWIPNETTRDAVLKRLTNTELAKSIVLMMAQRKIS